MRKNLVPAKYVNVYPIPIIKGWEIAVRTLHTPMPHTLDCSGAICGRGKVGLVLRKTKKFSFHEYKRLSNDTTECTINGRWRPYIKAV